MKEAVELLRKDKSPKRNVKPCNKTLLHSQINYVERHGGKVVYGGAEVEKHLDDRGAGASSLGDIIFLREDATTSEVLEEVFHFKQDARGDYAESSSDEVTLCREIDAQKYLLSVAKQYRIPKDEIELTKRNLKYYQEQLDEFLRGR